MPELPDIIVYVEALERFVVGHRLERIRLVGPSLLRTVDPQIEEICGRIVQRAGRIGKRILLEWKGDYFCVLHLMVAGRLHWKPAHAKVPGKVGLAAMDFPHGTLLVTEASTKKRASLHLVRGKETLKQFDLGGIDPPGG